MRKYILILLLFLSSFAQAQFGWSGLSANQWVSFSDAQGSGIWNNIPLPPSTQWMTKANAKYFLDIDTSSLGSVAQNQWITKSQLTGSSYSSSNTAYWQLSFFNGRYGQMIIYKNGSMIVNSSTDGANGTFSVMVGDIIHVYIYISYGGTCDGIIDAFGDNVLSDVIYCTGSGATQDDTFTWQPIYGSLSIYGIFRAPVSIYHSAAISNTYLKNNCGNGYVGSAVVYSVAYDKYQSLTSQYDADHKAVMDMLNFGQTYANSNGSCTAIAGYYNRIRYIFSTNNTNIEKSPYVFVLTRTSPNGDIFINRNTSWQGDIGANTGDVITITVTPTTPCTSIINIKGGVNYYTTSTSSGALTYTFTDNISMGEVDMKASMQKN